jgi:hypothetical protein
VSGSDLGDDSAILFETPAGWKVTNGTLSQLSTGHKYRVYVQISGSSKASFSDLTIPADDVSSLEQSKVLAADGDGGFAVMTEQEFRDRANAAC